MTAPKTILRATTEFNLRPTTLDDMPSALALANLCSRAVTGKDEFNLEDYRNSWGDPSRDIAVDTRIAQTADGTIVGCAEVWNNPPYVGCWIWVCVHPAFRGQGIGTALMDWAEGRAQVALERAPAGARIFLEASANSVEQPSIDLLTERSYTAVHRRLSMARDLSGELLAPAWPAGITVRTIHPGEALALYRAKNEAFRDHWGHVEAPEQEGFAAWEHRRIHDSSYDPSLWFLALDGDEIAGFSLCQLQTSEDPAMGWVSSLGVRRPWRRRGLARALLYHSFGELRRRGQSRIGLDVDASSLTGATRLYEQAGMSTFRQTVFFEKVLRSGADLATHAIVE
ncbi:MAG TPA: GNAT family N-acetyltransferase [Roseiflexaceae bacterium]|nr:GNAT family N-acetyltransferase [Roseiflexaceae bacterium]